MTCRCGQPAHPLYGSRCEDCYARDMQGCFGQQSKSIVCGVGGHDLRVVQVRARSVHEAVKRRKKK